MARQAQICPDSDKKYAHRIGFAGIAVRIYDIHPGIRVTNVQNVFEYSGSNNSTQHTMQPSLDAGISHVGEPRSHARKAFAAT